MIQAKNVSFRYKKKSAIDDFSAEFKKGSVYGLLGTNGAGKSTILKLLSGLLFPNKGTILMNDLQPMKRELQCLTAFFFVPDTVRLPGISIPQFVDLYSPFYKDFDKAAFIDFLTRFNIGFNNDIEALSFGQKRIFVLCFAIASNSTYLFLDEPSNGLDIQARSILKKILAGYINESKCIIICSHQVHDFENLIDYILILKESKLIFSQSIDAISERITFLPQNRLRTQDSNLLYSEAELNGVALAENNTGEPSAVDIEALFRAVIANQNQINNLFKSTIYESTF